MNGPISVLLMLASIYLVSCGGGGQEPSELQTDLGEEGNELVLSFFNRYQTQQAEHCTIPRNNNPRLLITGFGPFNGRLKNLSGDLILRWNEAGQNPNNFGVNAFSSTWQTPEGEVDVCFLYLSVIWDLAAAIVVEEAKSFEPDLILSMGEGIALIS